MSNEKMNSEQLKTAMSEMGEKALFASRSIAAMSTDSKDSCLYAMADELEKNVDTIKKENAKDLKAGRKKGLNDALLDRLKLNDKRIESMASGLRDLAGLEDPCGKILSTTVRPNGLKIEKVSVPIGVIGIVYESRPNVTADAAGLCLKAGNAVFLRGGSEAIYSNTAIAYCLNHAAVSSGMPDGIIQLIPWTDREAVNIMLKMDNYISVIIPRGGEGLIKACVENSTIPVIKHYKGVCSVFVDSQCDMDMALKIVINSKCQRPGVCNAIETLLLHKDLSEDFIKKLASELIKNGVELRGSEDFRTIVPEISSASESDWYEEYLDLILAVKMVDSVEEAVKHINKYGSQHSDSIVSENTDSVIAFLRDVDSSTVYHNASTRFTDGAEFGMGAEIGISTDKLHARGPMGLPELNTYKYIVKGVGQIRK